jgi:hypothetical protein
MGVRHNGPAPFFFHSFPDPLGPYADDERSESWRAREVVGGNLTNLTSAHRPKGRAAGPTPGHLRADPAAAGKADPGLGRFRTESEAPGRGRNQVMAGSLCVGLDGWCSRDQPPVWLRVFST